MSIHVCSCMHHGVGEWHLRYPGMSQEAAQGIADKINSGMLDGKQADRIAALEAELAANTLPCGHHHSLMLKSAETGDPLYCELCDLRAQRNDLEIELAAIQRVAEQYQDEAGKLTHELAQARAECERLLEVLMQMIELAEYWFTRENRQGYSEQQYKAWHSLGFGSTAMRNARSAIDAARKDGTK